MGKSGKEGLCLDDKLVPMGPFTDEPIRDMKKKMTMGELTHAREGDLEVAPKYGSDKSVGKPEENMKKSCKKASRTSKKNLTEANLKFTSDGPDKPTQEDFVNKN